MKSSPHLLCDISINIIGNCLPMQVAPHAHTHTRVFTQSTIKFYVLSKHVRYNANKYLTKYLRKQWLESNKLMGVIVVKATHSNTSIAALYKNCLVFT